MIKVFYKTYCFGKSIEKKQYFNFFTSLWVKVKSEVAQSCPTLWNPRDCSLWDSSIHGIYQARELEWVAISFCRGSFWPRDRTRVSLIASRCFYHLSHQGSCLFWYIKLIIISQTEKVISLISNHLLSFVNPFWYICKKFEKLNACDGWATIFLQVVQFPIHFVCQFERWSN